MVLVSVPRNPWYGYQEPQGQLPRPTTAHASTSGTCEAVLLGTISAGRLSPMRARHLIFLLGLYVSLDLANPFMPGAFNFNPDDSVDGVRLQYEVFRSRLAVIPTPPSIRDAAPNASGRHGATGGSAGRQRMVRGSEATPVVIVRAAPHRRSLASRRSSPITGSRSQPGHLLAIAGDGCPRVRVRLHSTGRTKMADLTEAQKQAYWSYNIRLTTILLVIWFVVTYLISGPVGRLAQQLLVPRLPARVLHGGPGLARDLRHRDRGVRPPHEQEGRRVRHPRGGLAAMSLDKIFGLYTVVLPRRHHPHRHRRDGLRAAEQVDRLDLHGPVAADLRRHRHRDPHVERRPVLRRRPRRARHLQRHGDRLGLDVGGVVHLDGRRAVGAGLRGPRLRHGLDGRLSPARRLPRPLPPPVRRLHDPGLPRRPLRRQCRARRRRGRRRSRARSPTSSPR